MWTEVLAAVLTAMVVSGLALAAGIKDAAPRDARGVAQPIVLIDRETDDFSFTDIGNEARAGETPPYGAMTCSTPRAPRSWATRSSRARSSFDTPPVAQCDVVARLDGRGDIVLSGARPQSADPFLLAVTGGTGEFRHVRGQALVELAAEGPPITRRVTLELRGVR